MSNLHELVIHRDVVALQAAFAAGADPNQPGRYGETPLMIAISLRDAEIFGLLLAHGADLERSDDSNHTALHAAVVHD